MREIRRMNKNWKKELKKYKYKYNRNGKRNEEKERDYK